LADLQRNAVLARQAEQRRRADGALKVQVQLCFGRERDQD